MVTILGPDPDPELDAAGLSILCCPICDFVVTLRDFLEFGGAMGGVDFDFDSWTETFLFSDSINDFNLRARALEISEDKISFNSFSNESIFETCWSNKDRTRKKTSYIEFILGIINRNT